MVVYDKQIIIYNKLKYLVYDKHIIVYNTKNTF